MAHSLRFAEDITERALRRERAFRDRSNLLEIYNNEDVSAVVFFYPTQLSLMIRLTLFTVLAILFQIKYLVCYYTPLNVPSKMSLYLIYCIHKHIISAGVRCTERLDAPTQSAICF